MKKVLSLFLCLCLCLTLFSALGLTVSAAIDAIVYVNGQSLAVGSSLNVNGGTAKAEYNGGTDTLIITLDNCSIGSTVNVGGTSYGFYVKSDITNIMVKLNGENVCESNFRIQGNTTYEDGTTNILSGASGDGSLTVNGNFSVEHGDVYVDACELMLTGNNTNLPFAAYINNSLTIGSAVNVGGTISEPYIQIETYRNIGMWVEGPATVNSGNSTFTGRYYGLFVKGSGKEPIFNVNGGYTACNGNQAGILLMFNRDYGVDPVSFTNGCGEFNFGKLACREDFFYSDSYQNAKFFSWMKPEWTDDLIINGAPDDVYGGTLSCNAMTSVYFRQMGGVYVTFDCGEYGEVAGQQSWIQMQEYGEKIGLLPVPVNTTFRDGSFNNMYFSGWYIDEGDLFDVIDENYVLTHNITLHALWTEGQGTPFTDVKDGNWFKEAADYCYGQGLISGTGDGTKFSPNTVCTRAMVVSILYRLSGSPYVWEGYNQFSDVKNNAWYAKAVIWAAESGIVSGVGGGKFSPDASITREQLASIMMRYASFRGLCDPDAGVMLIGFPDNDKVSSWAGDGMAWAVGTGLISGKPKNGQNYLDPKGTATRAEFASIMERFAKLTDGALTFFINDSFRVTVPDLWQGNVVCGTSSSERGDWITFYCKQENELSGAGRICSLLITDGYDYFDFPRWEFFGAMLDDDNQIAYNVVFVLPTDVQYHGDPSSPLATAYFSMSIMKDALQVESDRYHMSHGVG